MWASELPFEIIAQIADFLLKNDKYECSLTCKRWRALFQQSILKNIKVDTMIELEEICNLIKNPTSNSPPYDLIVQGLRFTGPCKIDLQQSDIFQILPNLKHLFLESLHINQEDIGLASYYRPLKFLVSIKLQIKVVKLPMATDILVEYLENIPHLQKLDVTAYSSVSPLRFSSNSFNTLHRTLPHLAYIKACLILTDIHKKYVQEIPKTVPALSVTTLDLSIVDWDHPWLYYFTYKYPYLRTLMWRTSCAATGWIVKNYEERNVALLHSIATVFPHLETVDFYTEDCTEWSHAIFWDLLCRSNVPIKTIKYETKYSDCEASFLKTIIQRFLQSFSKTIETFSIVGNMRFKFKNIARPEFSYCPQLVDLEIKFSGVSIALDNLLDNCIALRQFKYVDGRLYIDSKTYGEPMQHGLQTLDTDGVVANAAVFDYLSFRCRSLEYMDLTQAQICGSLSDDTRSLHINMIYTRLKVLNVFRARFYSSDERMNKNTIINLVLLSQLTDTGLSSEKRQLRNMGPNVKHLAWLHLYCKLDYPSDYAPKIRNLSEQEVVTITNYYQKRLFKESVTVQEAERSINGQTFAEDWKADLYRGYAELRCGFIADCRVPLS
ncbi:hypothetical protein J3Q64DRAFT_1747646 [Phycomyces blakesleeanus]|uniref:F-box domain-containing protein n=2 Tax=Phycomyces blakesleeanus TaxID=4837 RepID=A0A162PSL6_PHYB8|nr:hypothetical protein PHYBLDRAFT_187420 [Phycomyces blakesleeanus NRRL 1555(-)]OAD72526.1 hypothetical protein PHYBLDRAFT_187420 [Phycomyces blakesleeanus NRRL 1555(-)]|eukprot:XP_018290566.1 hypothetical protein PHYBLDRAFT_187420 [Phycomyces blakesleeanus NRRL 1555(-)]